MIFYRAGNEPLNALNFNGDLFFAGGPDGPVHRWVFVRFSAVWVDWPPIVGAGVPLRCLQEENRSAPMAFPSWLKMTAVQDFQGPIQTFTRIGDSGNKVRYEFCPSCATTLRWHVDIVPNRQVFAGGAFDDMRQFDVIAEMYTDEAVPWALLGCELSRPKSPDDHFASSWLQKQGIRERNRRRDSGCAVRAAPTPAYGCSLRASTRSI